MSDMTVVQEIKEGFNAFKAAQEQSQSALADLIKATKKDTELVGVDAKAALARAEESAKMVLQLSDRLLETEQKVVAGIVQDKLPPKTIGQFVVESDLFKQFATGAINKMRIEANTITGTSGSPADNSDILVPTQRLPGIIPGAFRQLRIADVMPQGNTSSNLVEFTRELAFVNNAAEVQEAGQKPESEITFEQASEAVRTIAHWIKVSKQVIDDAPALASYIDGRLRYGVDKRLDSQLFAGNGTAPNISGMTVSGNYTAFTPTTGDTDIDSINRAKYAIIAADYEPNAVLMNPADWSAIERLKDSNNNYIVGDPFGAIVPRMWGMLVILSNAVTSGKLFVADFNIAYQLWNRQGTTVEMTDSDGTDFQKNLITIRAERRAMLATYVPAATRYGNI